MNASFKLYSLCFAFVYQTFLFKFETSRLKKCFLKNCLNILLITKCTPTWNFLPKTSLLCLRTHMFTARNKNKTDFVCSLWIASSSFLPFTAVPQTIPFDLPFRINSLFVEGFLGLIKFLKKSSKLITI